MVDTLRKCLVLLGPGTRARWVVVIALALVVSGFEALGAGIVYALLARITTDASGFEIPGLGDLRTVLPGLSEMELMAVVGVLIAAFYLTRGLAIIAQTYVQYRVAERAGARLSRRLLEGYLAMPATFHLQRNSSELIRNAYDTVQLFVKEGLVPAVKLVSQGFIIAALLIVLLVTSPIATLLAIGVLGPFTWLLLRAVLHRVKRLGKRAQALAKTSLQSLQQSLDGWRDITLLDRRRAFVEQFGDDRDRYARARYLKSTAKELPRVALETGLVLVILAFLGASVVLQGGALQALPVLGLFGYAAVRLQPSLNEALAALNSLKFIGPGIDLLHDDLVLFEQATQRDGTGEAEAALPLRRELRLDDVHYRYPEAHADTLAAVNLVVRAGESVGIVGPTGGGKSTLVDLMLGLLEPTAGRVTVDGTDLREEAAAWHRSVGVVSQTIFLTDDTLRRNIALGVPDDEIDETAVAEAVHLAQLDEFVASLPSGLDSVVGERGVRVSGGQRQRLAIARALYRRPQVLVFDEGTSALDNETETELLAALERLRGQRTVIAVAHRLSTVAQADVVVFVRDGRIADVGPYDALASRHASLRARA